jgi:hypothetical protein
MTTLVDHILHEAVERIASGRILSSGNLTAFLQTASYREGIVSERELIDAALHDGLYADLGRKYQLDLDAIIDRARAKIVTGAIQTSTALRLFLESAAPSCVSGCDPYKVENDLLIDARQKRLYELLPEVQVPLALSIRELPVCSAPVEEANSVAGLTQQYRRA